MKRVIDIVPASQVRHRSLLQLSKQSQSTVDAPFTEAGLSLGAYACLRVGCADGGGMLAVWGRRGTRRAQHTKTLLTWLPPGRAGPHLSWLPGPQVTQCGRHVTRGSGSAAGAGPGGARPNPGPVIRLLQGERPLRGAVV